MSRLPSTTLLRCFDASARLQSFTRAAEELFLTQSAVSHNVLLLEKHLGLQLFTRKRTGLELTPAGRRYWSDIATPLRQLERATDAIVLTKGGGGSLNLSVTSSFANYWLLPRLNSFVSANPDITLNLSTRVGQVDFFNSDADAAIEFCSPPGLGVAARLVASAGLRPYASRAAVEQFVGSPVSREVLLDKPMLTEFLKVQTLIRREAVADAWPAWLQISDIAEVPQEHLEAGPRYALMSMALNGVMSGIGVALLPDFMVEGAVAAGRLVCVSSASWTPPQGYYLIWPEWRANLDVLERFSTWLDEQSGKSSSCCSS